MRDMLNNKTVVDLGLVTVSGATPAASAWVDTRGYDACTLVLVTNAVTDAGTADGFTVTAQKSDTTAAADAVAWVAADSVDGEIALAVTLDTADNVIVGGLGYRGGPRYVRMRAVGTTDSDAVVRVFAVLNKPHRAPTTFVGASVAAT